jgi:hypothetical protein
MIDSAGHVPFITHPGAFNAVLLEALGVVE